MDTFHPDDGGAPVHAIFSKIMKTFSATGSLTGHRAAALAPCVLLPFGEGFAYHSFGPLSCASATPPGGGAVFVINDVGFSVCCVRGVVQVLAGIVCTKTIQHNFLATSFLSHTHTHNNTCSLFFVHPFIFKPSYYTVQTVLASM